MSEGTTRAAGISRLRAERRYRVAMVAPCPFPSLRGSQVLIRETAEALAERGHAVHVVTYPTAEHLAPVKRIAIHRIAKIPGLWTTRPLGWQKLVLDVLLLFRLYRVVREHRVELIHAHNLEGPLIAYVVRFLTGVPVIYHAHNALTDELPCYAKSTLGRRLARWIGRVLDRCVAAGADFSIALTDRLAAFLAARGAAGRVAVIPPAVRPLRFPERSAPRRAEGPRIVYAGNLDPYQDLPLLLEAFERVRGVEPHARLELVTHAGLGGWLERRHRALSGRAGVSVRVLPTFAAVARILHEADVVVCPRSSWSGFPIKVLNYMAAGRPIVHARASAHPIEDGVNGLVFADGDARALAQRIVRLLRDGELAGRLGRKARVTARAHYSWPRILPLMLEVYRRTLLLRRSAAAEGGSSMPAPSTRCDSAPPRSGQPPLTRYLALVLLGLALAPMAACSSKRNLNLAPLPPVSAPGATGLPEVNALYRIQAYDTLRVKFVYHPDLDIRVPVRPDGGINIAGVGEFQAAGKTTEQLAREIERVSSDRLREPQVEVIVAELGRYNVWVFGEVRSPGLVPFREGMTPIQAISDRGGFTDYARADSVLRITPEGTATRVDLTGNLPDTITVVEANEVIYVPRTFIGDTVAFVRTVRNLLPVQPRFGFGYSLD